MNAAYHAQREPALTLLPVLSAVVVTIAHFAHFSAATTSIVLAVCTAAGAVVIAVMAKPWQPAIVAGAVTAFLSLVSNYWWHLPKNTIAEWAVIFTAVIGYVLRHQLTPAVQPPA